MRSVAAAAQVREENMGDPIYADIANSYFAAQHEISSLVRDRRRRVHPSAQPRERGLITA
jgi:hypothetical protein